MLNPELIDDHVREDIENNMPDYWSEEEKLTDIKYSSVFEALNRYMDWNGISGYTENIIEAHCNLLAAEVPTYDETERDGSIIHDGKLKEFSETINIVDDIQVGEVLVITKLSSGHFYARVVS